MAERVRIGRWLVVLVLVWSAPVHGETCEDQVAELDRLMAENQAISESSLEAVRMQRDLGARYCREGQEQTARALLEIPLRSMRERADEAAAQQARTLPKSSLTAAYLRGDWCTWQLTEDAAVRRDVARYHFYADGSFHLGMPPEFRLDTSSGPRSRDRFLAGSHIALLERGPDRFRTEVHGVRVYTWRRGGC